MATAPLSGNNAARDILPTNNAKEVKSFTPKAKPDEKSNAAPIEGKQVEASVNTSGQTTGTKISTSA